MQPVKTSTAIAILITRLKNIPDDDLTTLYGFIVTEWKRRKQLKEKAPK